jgi:hypothetical protein
MKTTRTNKSKPAVKHKTKIGSPPKGRIRPKVKEDVCYSTDTVVPERLCCCEDLCC